MRRQSLRSSEGQGTFRGSGALRTLEQLRCALGPAIDAKSLGTGFSLHGVLVTSNVHGEGRARLLHASRSTVGLGLNPSPARGHADPATVISTMRPKFGNVAYSRTFPSVSAPKV